MIRRVAFALSLITLAAAAPIQAPPAQAPAPAFDPAGSDPAAIELVKAMHEWMGGLENWERLPYVKFTFEVVTGEDVRARRTILWDRPRRRAAVNLVTNRGELLVLVDLTTRQGKAFENGEPVTAEDHDAVVAKGHEFFINDSYWLIAPWKLFDPGVHLRTADDVEVDGERMAQVKVTFDPGIGLTPGDTYWFAIDPDDHALRQWSFHLEGYEPQQAPTTFTWEDWVEKDGVKFSLLHREAGGDRAIRFVDFEVRKHIAAEIFAPLEPKPESDGE